MNWDPSVRVETTGSTSVCDVEPVNTWTSVLETVSVVLPPAVAVDVDRGISLLKLTDLFASHPTKVEAVGVVVTVVAPVPPITMGIADPVYEP
jgi:hypothetical protein